MKIFILKSKKHGNKEVIIDDEDYDRVSSFKWSLLKQKGNKFRVVRQIQIKYKRQELKLHRYILDVKDKNIQVDHINGNPLDNRKCNLRLCSNKENSRNRKTNNKTGYKGVYKFNRNLKKPYIACITFNYKQINLGYFETPKEAAIAYNKAAIKYFKDFALLNIITKERRS